MHQWIDRITRALRLDSELFEEVEHDYSAGSQALMTVLAASACGGIGNLAAAWILGMRPNPWPSLIMMVAGFLVAWIVWSFVTMAIGTSIFGGRADMGEMQRALRPVVRAGPEGPPAFDQATRPRLEIDAE